MAKSQPVFPPPLDVPRAPNIPSGTLHHQQHLPRELYMYPADYYLIINPTLMSRMPKPRFSSLILPTTTVLWKQPQHSSYTLLRFVPKNSKDIPKNPHARGCINQTSPLQTMLQAKKCKPHHRRYFSLPVSSLAQASSFFSSPICLCTGLDGPASPCTSPIKLLSSVGVK